MSTEKNREVALQWLEGAWNRGNLSLLDELYQPDYISHSMPPGLPGNRDGLAQLVTIFRTAMPDFHMTIEDMIAAGDKVAVRFVADGTQTGELMGIPPTGRHGSATGMIIARFEDGKWAEDWFNWDQFGMLQQLGVIPVPEGAGA